MKLSKLGEPVKVAEVIKSAYLAEVQATSETLSEHSFATDVSLCLSAGIAAVFVAFADQVEGNNFPEKMGRYEKDLTGWLETHSELYRDAVFTLRHTENAEREQNVGEFMECMCQAVEDGQESALNALGIEPTEQERERILAVMGHPGFVSRRGVLLNMTARWGVLKCEAEAELN